MVRMVGPQDAHYPERGQGFLIRPRLAEERLRGIVLPARKTTMVSVQTKRMHRIRWPPPGIGWYGGHHCCAEWTCKWCSVDAQKQYRENVSSSRRDRGSCKAFRMDPSSSGAGEASFAPVVDHALMGFETSPAQYWSKINNQWQSGGASSMVVS